jgi:hypothetical protein
MMAISLSGLNRSPWFHLLGGAVIWSVHFLASYNWVEFACSVGLPVLGSTVLGLSLLSWSVLVLTFLATLAALYVGWAAYRNWRRIRESKETNELDAWAVETHRFMAFSGMFLSTLFALIILFTGLPALVLGPCT